MAKKNDKNEAPSGPLLPWGLLFSRSGQVPLEEDAVAEPGESLRPMTEKEGRAAFVLWIVAGAVLCLLVAIFAVSCSRGEIPAEEKSAGGGLWTAALILILLIIIAAAAADFRKAWRAQQKKTGKTSAKK